MHLKKYLASLLCLGGQININKLFTKARIKKIKITWKPSLGYQKRKSERKKENQEETQNIAILSRPKDKNALRSALWERKLVMNGRLS
jgi:hypothetical protein